MVTASAGLASEPRFREPNAGTVAIIIGNKNYRHSELPNVERAYEDAEAMRRFAVDVLGVPTEDVRVLRDATKAMMETVFGNSSNHRGRLLRHGHLPDPAHIIIYYSGHGAPGARNKRPHLMPVEAHPDSAEVEGYSLIDLYVNLYRLNVTTATLLLDTGFSGATHRGMAISKSRPVAATLEPPYTVPGLVVMTASSGAEASYGPATKTHGPFTEFLLQGLYGAADRGPGGNGDGQITIAELKSYLDRNMSPQVLAAIGRPRQAEVLGDASRVVVQFDPGKLPLRPQIDLAAIDAATVFRLQPIESPTVRAEPGPTFRDCPTCPEMVTVPAGSFVMGSNAVDSMRGAFPARRVELASFGLGRTEVTIQQWRACAEAADCKGDLVRDAPGTENLPVNGLSWQEAQSYIAWLRRITGKRYRLPSESEWEYAARGGTTSRYVCGNDWRCLNDIAWYSRNSGGAVRPVATKRPNAFGLYDMLGNVGEWVEDCRYSSFFGAPTDGRAWVASNCKARIWRGGDWDSSPADMPVDSRWSGDIESRYRAYGLRVARDLAP